MSQREELAKQMAANAGESWALLPPTVRDRYRRDAARHLGELEVVDVDEAMEKAAAVVNAEIDALFADAVNRATGVEGWAGDVDPPTTRLLNEALRTTLRQLCRNAFEKAEADKAAERTNAEKQVGDALDSRLNHIGGLQAVAEGDGGGEFTNDELLGLGVGEQAGPVSDEQLAEEAFEALDELPLSVERRTVFEIVLGTGGPDERLVFECDRFDPERDGIEMVEYEIRGVGFEYTWSGSAQLKLYGEQREIAEAFARRVVPELAD